MLEHAVHVERAGARLVAVVGHEDDRVLVVGALDERPQLAVEHAVDVAHAVGDRRGRRLGVPGWPGWTYSSRQCWIRSGETKTRQAASHSSVSSSRRIASARAALVRSTSSTRSSGRPRKVVHEPPLIGQPRLGPISARVAERRAAGDHAAGDRDAVHVGRRDRSAGCSRSRPARPAVESRSRPRRREDRPRRDGHPPARARLVLEDVEDAVSGRDRARSGTSAMPPRSATGCTIARRRAGRAR